MGRVLTHMIHGWTRTTIPALLWFLLSGTLSACGGSLNKDPVLSIRPVATEVETIGVVQPSIATYIPPTPTPAPRPITATTVSDLKLLRRLGTGLVQNLYWSENETQLIVVTSYGVYLHNAETLDLEESFILPSEYVLAEISPHGKYGVVVDLEGRSFLISIRTEMELMELRDDWTVLSWSKDSSRLLIGHQDGAVHIVDTATGDMVWDFTLSRFVIEEVTFSPSGDIALAKDEEGWFVFWELDNGTELLRDRIMLARKFQITPDDNAFVFIAGLGALNVWTLPDKWLIWQIEAEIYGPKVESYVIHPEGERILLSYQTRTVNEVRDLQTGEKLGVTAYPEEFEGGILATKQIKFWIRNQKEIEIRDTVKNDHIVSMFLTDYGECLEFSGDESVFATNYGLWDVWNGENLLAINGDCPISFSLDGMSLGIRKNSRVVEIVDIDDMEEVAEFVCRNIKTYSPQSLINFSINVGATMVACYPGGERVHVYDVISGEEIFEFRTIRYDTALSFSADSKYLGALGHGFLRIWDLETGYLLREPLRVEEPVNWLASEDLMTWKLHYREGRDVVVTWNPTELEEQSRTWLETDPYLASKLSPDGRFLVLATLGGIDIWSTSTGQLLFSEEWPRGIPPDARLAFSPNGYWLAMYVSGGPIWIWGITD